MYSKQLTQGSSSDSKKSVTAMMASSKKESVYGGDRQSADYHGESRPQMSSSNHPLVDYRRDSLSPDPVDPKESLAPNEDALAWIVQQVTVGSGKSAADKEGLRRAVMHELHKGSHSMTKKEMDRTTMQFLISELERLAKTEENIIVEKTDDQQWANWDVRDDKKPHRQSPERKESEDNYDHVSVQDRSSYDRKSAGQWVSGFGDAIPDDGSERRRDEVGRRNEEQQEVREHRSLTDATSVSERSSSADVRARDGNLSYSNSYDRGRSSSDRSGDRLYYRSEEMERDQSHVHDVRSSEWDRSQRHRETSYDVGKNNKDRLSPEQYRTTRSEHTDQSYSSSRELYKLHLGEVRDEQSIEQYLSERTRESRPQYKDQIESGHRRERNNSRERRRSPYGRSERESYSQRSRSQSPSASRDSYRRQRHRSPSPVRGRFTSNRNRSRSPSRSRSRRQESKTCKHCHSTFTEARYLWKHLASDHEDKELVIHCTRNCGFKTVKHEHLLEHMERCDKPLNMEQSSSELSQLRCCAPECMFTAADIMELNRHHFTCIHVLEKAKVATNNTQSYAYHQHNPYPAQTIAQTTMVSQPTVGSTWTTSAATGQHFQPPGAHVSVSAHGQNATAAAFSRAGVPASQQASTVRSNTTPYTSAPYPPPQHGNPTNQSSYMPIAASTFSVPPPGLYAHPMSHGSGALATTWTPGDPGQAEKLVCPAPATSCKTKQTFASLDELAVHIVSACPFFKNLKPPLMEDPSTLFGRSATPLLAPTLANTFRGTLLQCQICGFSADDKHTLWRHLLYNHKPRDFLYECVNKGCNFRTITQDGFSNHEKDCQLGPSVTRKTGVQTRGSQQKNATERVPLTPSVNPSVINTAENVRVSSSASVGMLANALPTVATSTSGPDQSTNPLIPCPAPTGCKYFAQNRDQLARHIITICDYFRNCFAFDVTGNKLFGRSSAHVPSMSDAWKMRTFAYRCRKCWFGSDKEKDVIIHDVLVHDPLDSATPIDQTAMSVESSVPSSVTTTAETVPGTIPTLMSLVPAKSVESSVPPSVTTTAETVPGTIPTLMSLVPAKKKADHAMSSVPAKKNFKADHAAPGSLVKVQMHVEQISSKPKKMKTADFSKAKNVKTTPGFRIPCPAMTGCEYMGDSQEQLAHHVMVDCEYFRDAFPAEVTETTVFGRGKAFSQHNTPGCNTRGLPYRCRICGFSSNFEKAVITHAVRYHNPKQFTLRCSRKGCTFSTLFDKRLALHGKSCKL